MTISDYQLLFIVGRWPFSHKFQSKPRWSRVKLPWRRNDAVVSGHGCKIRRARRRLQLRCHHKAGSLSVQVGIWSRDCALLVSPAFYWKKSLVYHSWPGLVWDLEWIWSQHCLAWWIIACYSAASLAQVAHTDVLRLYRAKNSDLSCNFSRHMIRFLGTLQLMLCLCLFPRRFTIQYYVVHLHMLYGWCIYTS